ncbi:uncharacterized protein LOC135834651 [Planococcus citri]|uniref:uncharacterized protein LOC135834651 n=1 Tax=Planococcus citri TaxID=170843 RepID=UPI0031F76A0A
MVKVREFCCGCSLRSGTFIIAWGSLMNSCLFFILCIVNYLNLLRRSKLNSSYQSSYSSYTISTPSPYIFMYNIIRIAVGIAVSILAIWAIQKNKVKFLDGLFWYLCYTAGALAFSSILVLFLPSWELALSGENPIVQGQIKYSSELENRMFLFFLYLFGIGMLSYFALVVKSFRDYSLRNSAQNGQFVGPDPTAVGFLAA